MIEQELQVKLLPSVYRNKLIRYIKNCNICEYDMSSAGLNILMAKKLITEAKYNELKQMPKLERNIAIGRLEASSDIIRAGKNAGFKEYITRFIYANNIPLEAILSIKKDAVFLINQNPGILTFDNFVTFSCKNVYTSYCTINNKEFYYNSISNVIDIKGFNSEANVSNNALVNDIKMLLRKAEKLDKLQMYNVLNQYRSDFLNRKLNCNVYRDLDTGLYIVKTNINTYTLENIDRHILPVVNINNTYITYILELIKILI